MLVAGQDIHGLHGCQQRCGLHFLQQQPTWWAFGGCLYRLWLLTMHIVYICAGNMDQCRFYFDQLQVSPEPA